MFDATPTKPQSVGDLIGRAFRVYRVNIPLFVQVLMWPTVFSIVGKVGMQWGVTEVAHKEAATIVLGISAMLVGSIVSIVCAFILTLRQLAFVRMINGFAADFKAAYAHVKQRMWSFLGLIIVGDLIAFWALIVWVVVVVIAAMFMRGGQFMLIMSSLGILSGALGMILTLLLYWLIGFICISLATCEDCGIGAAIGRGFNLTFRDFGRAFLFGFILLMTVMMLSYPLQLPTVALSFFEFFRHGMSAENISDPMKIPLYLIVLTQAWESIVNMLLWPVTYLAFGLFYYDLRMRQEGIDVLQKLTLIDRPAV